MRKFEIGKKYQTRSIGDYNCVIVIEISQRTPKTVTVKSKSALENGKRYKIFEIGGFEFIFPWGKYSMSPVLSSSDIAT